jgi:hypothetical protein
MPTRHPRIPVIEDPELARALERAGPLLPARSKPALLRALALRGAQQVIGEEDRRRQLLERVADWSTDPEGLDWQAVREAHERGWHDA